MTSDSSNTFKILTLGESEVGKTSILTKYCDDKFLDTHLATIGVEFKSKTIFTDKYKVTLNVWDTAGQERFRSITKTFFQNANGVIFVYDITSNVSFNGVKN